jgi:hypothetical protein
MRRYKLHYKVIKDCFQGICRAVAENISSTELDAILSGLVTPEGDVRLAILQAISTEISLSDHGFCKELWTACHDVNQEVAELAMEVWEEEDLTVHPLDAKKLLPYLESKDRQLRVSASKSIAAAVGSSVTTFEDITQLLEETYIQKAKPKIKEYDEHGMLKKQDMTDPWEVRSGIALAFKESVESFDSKNLIDFVTFLISRGPLMDINSTVRQEFIDATASIIIRHGEKYVEELMSIFEKCLDTPDSGSKEQDRVNEGVIILYGALAQHLQTGDNRIPKVIKRLLLTLSTPSETVQSAVADCLPPLIKATQKSAPGYYQELMEQLLQSKSYASRRGAAYGLSGLVNGCGIGCIRELRIISTLRVATENKKEIHARQGALFAYEILSMSLGELFEPYVIQIVPQLLGLFGDANGDVREACLDASKVCFSNLSSYGVKLILPTLLDGLEEDQWRSKKGACDLLGAMAYLDPEQLASSLPKIIPPLTNVITDSHKEVRNAANRSLQRFGDVINNPEIKTLVGTLLKALSDPTKHTNDALDALIKVSFVHYLDPPSLALVR